MDSETHHNLPLIIKIADPQLQNTLERQDSICHNCIHN